MGKVKYLYGVIAMASVIAMFIWSFIEGTWAHCWLAVLFAPFLMAALTAATAEKKNWKRWSPAVSIGSVIIMFIWSFIANSWSYCWISVMIGGLFVVLLGALDKMHGDED